MEDYSVLATSSLLEHISILHALEGGEEGDDQERAFIRA